MYPEYLCLQDPKVTGRGLLGGGYWGYSPESEAQSPESLAAGSLPNQQFAGAAAGGLAA